MKLKTHVFIRERGREEGTHIYTEKETESGLRKERWREKHFVLHQTHTTE